MKAIDIFNTQLKIADALNTNNDTKRNYMLGVVSTMVMCGKIPQSAQDVYVRIVKSHYLV